MRRTSVLSPDAPPPKGAGLFSILLSAVLLCSWPHRAEAADRAVADGYGGRTMLVYVPTRLTPAGTRALVVVLHGGLGNALRIESKQSESGLNMDVVADQYGFVVAYLNGTPVTRRLGADMLGWNAGGGCCGLAAENNVDDVDYIQKAVGYLVGKYGIDRSRVYGMGHSNGAMLTQRLLCETTLYAAGIAISGPLNLDTESCPRASGRRILALHGANDDNVPIAGGRGTKGLSNAVYNSEDRSRRIFEHSGATYTLQVVQGADHKLDSISAAIRSTEGQTLTQNAANFFGLATSSP